MTHFLYFFRKLFVSFEVILIKYFYISTEIFSCHYDMMNYARKFVMYSHWWLYSFSFSGPEREHTKERAGNTFGLLYASLLNIFSLDFFMRPKSWRIASSTVWKVLSTSGYEFVLFLSNNWIGHSRCIYFASCLSHSDQPRTGKRLRSPSKSFYHPNMYIRLKSSVSFNQRLLIIY